jgi:hypothetical protein
VPRTRPGVAPAKPPLDRAALRGQLVTLTRLAGPPWAHH